MANMHEVKNTKFEITAYEIMDAGARAISDAIMDKPCLMIISSELEKIVAATAAKIIYEKLLDL